ncbi:hypothetical protein EG359_19360 [Chryseobacterium joostei]|uniref:Uncharacterized protein n=1 Tax=Chryseobacterium joostei TaxID=112234 RepID=A0A1N7J370_9FLAO|nr:hypothetical protein EG359_19360 [Chryseobacterium joostei]SIS43803.1 hypothetical protein SAMN05421768_107243 [Chryseobacterium joostei]
MKIKVKEKNKLPLTFKHIEVFEDQKLKQKNDIIYFVTCEKYQTDFYIREKPVKSLNRLL